MCTDAEEETLREVEDAESVGEDGGGRTGDTQRPHSVSLRELLGILRGEHCLLQVFTERLH